MLPRFRCVTVSAFLFFPVLLSAENPSLSLAQGDRIMKYVPAIVLTMLLLLPSLSAAAVKEIIAEGSYNMGDGETPNVAESRALVQAKAIALERAGTYVASYSKVKNIKLMEDEIQVVASGLMDVEILEKKRTIV